MTSFDIKAIKESQQNRYPMLFVDKILHVIPKEQAVGIKMFSYNEWFFPAYFEDQPNVPGTIQMECMTQVFLMTFLCLEEYKGQKTNSLKIHHVKYQREIVPGDCLQTTAILHSLKRGIAKGSAEGYVNDSLACSIELTVVMPEILKKFTPQK